MIYKDNQILAEAIKSYYELNGLPLDGGVTDRWARYRFGSVQAIAFPNFKLRNEALRRHDIHHIINDLDTSPEGEGLIAAWELGSGCGKYWISWFMESQALWWGILLAPRRALKLFAIGRISKNFFVTDLEQDLLKLNVGVLRSKMLPAQINQPLRFVDLLLFALAAAFGALSVVIFVPIASFFTLFGFIIGFNQRITNPNK